MNFSPHNTFISNTHTNKNFINSHLEYEKNEHSNIKKILIIVVAIFGTLLIPFNIQTIKNIKVFSLYISHNSTYLEILNVTNGLLDNHEEIESLYIFTITEITLLSILLFLLLICLFTCKKYINSEEKFFTISFIQSFVFFTMGMYGIHKYNNNICSIVPNMIFGIINSVILIIYIFFHFGFYDACRNSYTCNKVQHKTQKIVTMDKTKNISDLESTFFHTQDQNYLKINKQNASVITDLSDLQYNDTISKTILEDLQKTQTFNDNSFYINPLNRSY